MYLSMYVCASTYHIFILLKYVLLNIFPKDITSFIALIPPYESVGAVLSSISMKLNEVMGALGEAPGS